MKNSYRFMVVDDDPMNNLICKYMILRFDPAAEVRLFTDPQVALTEIEKDYPSADIEPHTILFLDINMPQMSGWEFLVEFEAFSTLIQNQFTIFILSSSIDQIDREKSNNNRFISGFLSKPLNLDNINKLMANLVL